MYIFVCNTYALLLFVCLGVGSYGLARTEAGATPASLVVISPHLEMYFWTTRCGCASRPLEDEVLQRLASADPERPEERRFAGRGRQTPRWVQDPPTQEESPEETSRLWQFLQAFFRASVKVDAPVRCATGRTGCDLRTP